MRVKSLKTLLSNYETCLQFFEEKKNDASVDKTATAKAAGFLKRMEEFEFYFLLTVTIVIMERVEILNSELQKCELSINESHDKIRMVTKSLEQIRLSDDRFDAAWRKAVEGAKDLDLDIPKIPRVRRPSTRLDTASTSHAFTTPANFYKKMYIEILDNVLASMRDRFESEVSKRLVHFEKFIIGTECNAEPISSFYKDDLDADQLRTHHQLFLDILRSRKVVMKSLKEVVEYLKNNPNVSDLVPELIKLIRLILTIPSSSCTAERSFSALRRLKTWLRATMSQVRLNNLAVLHIHSDMAKDILNDETLLNEFIRKNHCRSSTFAIV